MRAATIGTFRRHAAAEEFMMRAAMPATSANDPDPLPAFAAPERVVLSVINNGTSRLVRLAPRLTYTIAEVK